MNEEQKERAEAAAAKFAGDKKSAPKQKAVKKPKSKTNVAVVEKPAKMTQEQADKKLSPLSAEINARFESISKLEGKADDHRLAAAIRIEQAKKIVVAAGGNFKEWATANLTQSYETVRKLAAIGAAPNPQLALEDMRGKNKAANKNLRDKKKTKEAEKKVFGSAVEVLEASKPEEAMKAVKKFAADNGLVVVSETEHKDAKQAKKSAEMKQAEPLTLEGLKTAFLALGARDKMAFVEFAATKVGGKFVSALEPSGDGDLLGIPKELRRSKA